MLTEIFDDLKEIKSGKKQLREFGVTVGIVMSAVALWQWYRHITVYPIFLICSLTLIFLGLLKPSLLKGLQKIWMGFAVIMGFFMSRIILSMVFFLIVTPIGILMRFLGKNFLNLEWKSSKKSYWENIEDVASAIEYEKQY